MTHATPEAGMRLVPEKWLEVARYATEPGLNAHEANVRRIEFDRIVSPLAVLSLAAAPVPPAGGEGEAQLRFMSANLRDIEGTEDFLIHYHERVLVADNIDAALAARAQPPAGEAGLPPIALDGPHRPNEQRQWLSRQLLDSRLTDAEAYSIVAYHPSVSDCFAHPAEPAARDGGEALRSALVWARYHVVNSVNSDRVQCLAAFDAALAAGGEK